MNIGNLSIQIGANVKPFLSGIKQVQSSLKDVGQQMTSVGQTLSTRLTLPIVAVGGLAIKTAAQFETLKVQLDTLTGSAEEGTRAFQRLQKFSAGTPFQLNDLVRANNTLLGFGMSTDDAFKSLQQLGDVASATGGDLQSIAVAFGQASAEGRLMTVDIRQLINQGVPAIQLLAETMGVAEGEILNLASEGEISFEILQRAISEATQEGGKFANATARQSQTIAGLFSTLKDNVSLALGELGQEIFDTLNLKEVITNATNFIGNLVEAFKNLSDEAKKRILIVAGLFASGGPLLIALGATLTLLSSITLPVIAFIAVIGTLGFVLQDALSQTDSFAGAMELIFNKMLNHTIGIVQDMFSTMDWANLGVFDSAISALEGLKRKVEETAQFTPLKNGVEFIKKTLTDLKSFIEEFSFNKMLEAPTSQGGSDPLSIGFASLPKQVDDINISLANMMAVVDTAVTKFDNFTITVSQGLNFANDIARTFTDNFGQGMANVIVQGEKLQETLRNIGRLLASAVIQKGLQALLMGGLGGEGFFGEGGGVIGKIFGGVFHTGGIVPGSSEKMALVRGGEGIFTPGQMQAMASGGSQTQKIMIGGEFRIAGSDLRLVLEEANYRVNR